MLNDAADVLATAGVEAAGAGIRELGFIYAFRQKILCMIMHEIYGLFEKVFDFELARKKAERTALLGERLALLVDRLLPKLPPFIDREQPESRKLLLRWPAACVVPSLALGDIDMLTSSDHIYMQVWHFLDTVHMGPPTSGFASTTHTQGTSWIELFSIFLIMGGNMDPKHCGDAMAHTSLRASLICFRRTVLKIAQTCMHLADQLFFTASKASVVRLRSVGITSFVPCFNGNVCLEHQMRRPLLAALLHMQQKLTMRDRLAMLRDDLFVIPARLKMRGCFSVPSFISHECELGFSASLLTCPDLAEDPLLHKPRSYLLTCHSCMYIKRAENTSLFHKGKWTAIKCRSCLVSASARKWLCPCGLRWHGCMLHAALGFACCHTLRKRKFIDPAVSHPVVSTNELPPPSLDTFALRARVKRRYNPCDVPHHIQSCSAGIISAVAHTRSRHGNIAGARHTYTRRASTKRRVVRSDPLASFERVLRARLEPFDPYIGSNGNG